MIRKLKYRIKQLSGTIALLWAKLSLAVIAFFILLGLLIFLTRWIFYQRGSAVDQAVFDYMLPYVNHTNTVIMQFFTLLGSHWFLVPAYGLVFAWYLFIHKNKWYFIKALITGVCGLLIMFGLKFYFNQSRPPIPLLKHVPGLSFPSGHAFMSLVFFGLFIYIVYRDMANKWLKWVTISSLLAIIFMVGLSRVYLRVHYASDVCAGFCFGILTLMILLWLVGQVEVFYLKKDLPLTVI